MIHFTWDENKNFINLAKHSVDFIEASTVFFDEDALIISDDEHSIEEERYVLIGLSTKGNVLVVCHCYRKNDEEIRIISSRKATKNESIVYERRKMN